MGRLRAADAAGKVGRFHNAPPLAIPPHLPPPLSHRTNTHLSSQEKEKSLRKALDCSRPAEALALMKKVGLDWAKEGKKLGLEEELRKAAKAPKEE